MNISECIHPLFRLIAGGDGAISGYHCNETVRFAYCNFLHIHAFKGTKDMVIE